MTHTPPFDTPGASPRMSADDVLRAIDAELSPRARLAAAAVLVAAAVVVAIVAALLLTEPALPGRTQAGFGLIVAAGLAWCVHSARALLRRRAPYARHRLAAATLAMSVTGLFVLAALALAWFEPARAGVGLLAACFMLPLLALAGWLHWRARRELRALVARRDALAGRIR